MAHKCFAVYCCHIKQCISLQFSVIQCSFLSPSHLCIERNKRIQLLRVEITYCPGQLACHRYDEMRREAASVKIQKHCRMHLAKNAYKIICASAVYIQTGMRRMACRNGLRFRRKTKGAIAIQSHCRAF